MSAFVNGSLERYVLFCLLFLLSPSWKSNESASTWMMSNKQLKLNALMLVP